MSETDKNSCGEAPVKPSNEGNSNHSLKTTEGVLIVPNTQSSSGDADQQKQANSKKSEGLALKQSKPVTANNSPSSAGPTGQDIEIENKELYQINNYLV